MWNVRSHDVLVYSWERKALTPWSLKKFRRQKNCEFSLTRWRGPHAPEYRPQSNCASSEDFARRRDPFRTHPSSGATPSMNENRLKSFLRKRKMSQNNQSINQHGHQTNQSINRSMESINQSINRTFNQSINRSFNQSINQSIDRYIQS